MPKITVAKSAGFCFGVKNALDLVLKQKEKTNIFGFLIHNSQVVEELNQRGINSIEKLEDVVSALSNFTPSENYWKPTAGNVGRTLSILLEWAKLYPYATWNVLS